MYAACLTCGNCFIVRGPLVGMHVPHSIMAKCTCKCFWDLMLLQSCAVRAHLVFCLDLISISIPVAKQVQVRIQQHNAVGGLVAFWKQTVTGRGCETHVHTTSRTRPVFAHPLLCHLRHI